MKIFIMIFCNFRKPQFFCVLALFAISQLDAQNLIDSDDWISGTSGATADYSLQGTTAHNSRITMPGPYGQNITVWRGSADGASGMNGGFSHNGLIVDTDKTYKISFWMRASGPNNCTNYSGFTAYYTGGGLVQPFEREDGNGVSWPYFSSTNLPDDKWYLVVGYIRPSTVNDIGDSGIYDPSLGSTSSLPSPTFGASDFIFPSNVAQINIRIRTFMWSCASGDMFVYDPRIEEISNTTSLETLLYGSNSDSQSPTAPTLVENGKTDTTVNLTWSGSSDNVGVTNYEVYRNNSLIATVGNISSYQAIGLTASTSYNFKVRALDAAGNESSDSNTIAVTTDASSGGSGGNVTWTKSGSNVSMASTSDNLAIGRSSVPAGYKLAVDGNIRTREVRVDQDSWPDYVFEEGYDLLSLSEIQKHIREKGHLPHIPSAKEVEANGIELGEMNRLLLEKIEELTLYILEQEKKHLEKEKAILDLKDRIKKIEQNID